MLNRGANRSAINEASAAMDLSVSRKIRQGYRKKGMLDVDITALLRKRENQNFETRAKELLKDATGQSAAAFDAAAWLAGTTPNPSPCAPSCGSGSGGSPWWAPFALSGMTVAWE